VTSSETWKGFQLRELIPFGVQQTLEGVRIPYLTREGKVYRHKLFAPDGANRWLGASKPAIPYGLETLNSAGKAVILTEGESCALALRLAYPRTAVLGLPGATSWQTPWRSYLAPYPAIYMSFDGDKAGDQLTNSVWKDLPEARRVHIPSGFDTRDVLQVLGKEAYRILLEDAIAGANFREAVRTSAASLERVRRVETELQARAA
jgi:DNA primase